MIPLPFSTLLLHNPSMEGWRKDVRDPVVLWEAAPGTALHLSDDDEDQPTVAGVEQVGPTVEDPLVFLFTRELNRPGVTDLLIGRSDENNLVVNHASVSRVHAKLDRDPVTKRWRLTDLGSLMGTRVEGTRLVKGVPELLIDRVHVEVGEVTLRFMQPASFLAYVEKVFGRAASGPL